MKTYRTLVPAEGVWKGGVDTYPVGTVVRVSRGFCDVARNETYVEVFFQRTQAVAYWLAADVERDIVETKPMAVARTWAAEKECAR